MVSQEMLGVPASCSAPALSLPCVRASANCRGIVVAPHRSPARGGRLTQSHQWSCEHQHPYAIWTRLDTAVSSYLSNCLRRARFQLTRTTGILCISLVPDIFAPLTWTYEAYRFMLVYLGCWSNTTRMRRGESADASGCRCLMDGESNVKFRFSWVALACLGGPRHSSDTWPDARSSCQYAAFGARTASVDALTLTCIA